MHLKVIASSDTLQSKAKILKTIKTAGAVAGIGYAAFMFSLPLLIHYGSGALGGNTSEILDDIDLATLPDLEQTVSLFKFHSAGIRGLIHTIGLSALSLYGFPLIRESVQKLLLPRYTLAELQAKFPELNSTDKKLFALRAGVQDADLLERVFDLLQAQEVLVPSGAGAYTVNAQNYNEDIYSALFELGLTIGQTDAVSAYLRDTISQNAELFFKHTLFGTQKFIARASKLTLDKQRLLAQAVFRKQLTPEREEAFLQFLSGARRRTVSIDTQIALSITLPFFVSIYNLLSGNYIPCCPIHASAIEECLGQPLQNYAGALPGLAESAFLAVMHGYISHLMEEHAENKAKKNLAEVMSNSQLAKEYLILREGRQILTPPEQIASQSLLILKQGQQLPVDAEALQQMTVFESHITGESVPVLKMPGQTVLAGAIVQNDTAPVQVIRNYEDSALAQMEKQIKQAVENKSIAEGAVEQFSKWWSPLACLGASSYFMYGVLSNNMFAIKNALTMLVATTPCALQTSIPIAKLAVIYSFAKDKIILRDPKALTGAAKTRIVVFDKTDTLTDSAQLSIRGLHYTADGAPEQDLPLLHALELLATHPIAEEIREYIGPQAQSPEIQNFQDLGKAARGEYMQNGQRHTVTAGSLKYLRENSLLDMAETAGISDDAVVMAVDGQPRLYLEYAETLRADAADAIIALQKSGKEIVIASGDSHQRVYAAVNLLNKELRARGAKPLENVHSNLKPEEKTALIRELQKGPDGAKRYVTMIGDGNNDSGALAAADFGISWNAKGLARNAAHALVTDGSHLMKVTEIFQTAKRYSRKIIQNIVFPTLFNILIIHGVVTDRFGVALNFAGNLISNSVGRAWRSVDMLIALIAHESLTLIASFNSALLGKKKEEKKTQEARAGNRN
ncbi:MAG: HAD-IC family P-type ATPase [Candidatus Margulisbacteria bacterium]|jgi:cation transport ATPase|nr:HAD-IC family P-type ATPase [Candidatus Margulisiibacteriota bacterium]